MVGIPCTWSDFHASLAWNSDCLGQISIPLHGNPIALFLLDAAVICKAKENDARMPNGDRVTTNDKGIQTSSTRDVTQVWVETSDHKVFTNPRVSILVDNVNLTYAF